MHTNSFTQKKNYTQKFLHREVITRRVFTHRRNCTQKRLHGEAFTQELLYTRAFTHGSSYTQTLLHKEAFTQRALTHRRVYRQKFLRKEIFTQSFYTPEIFTHKSFYKEVLTQRSCFYTQKFFHIEVFTHPWICSKKIRNIFLKQQVLIQKLSSPPCDDIEGQVIRRSRRWASALKYIYINHNPDWYFKFALVCGYLRSFAGICARCCGLIFGSHNHGTQK